MENIENTEKTMQHVQLPNDMALNDLTPKDMLIYLALKRHDGDLGCFPSLSTLKRETGASVPTIRKIINNLIDKKYVNAQKNKGGITQYTFSEYKKFEPFSYDFLDKKDISFASKAYLAATQQFMFKDTENYGKLSYSDSELAKKINMPRTSIQRCNTELERLKYMEIVKNNSKDIISGCATTTKIYNLSELGQAVIWTLKNHEDRISNTEDDVTLLKQTIEKLQESTESDRKLIDALTKELAEVKKTLKEPSKFTM